MLARNFKSEELILNYIFSSSVQVKALLAQSIVLKSARRVEMGNFFNFKQI
jgi:hypothetical protein